ncbi:MAG: cytidylate kinase-like family protein [Prolixibacteraceae bacterium]|jgi:cytidylate kinase|nr:cytidylate kinase-like family protein [Prolixibacteraceae bacterium]
MKDIFNEYMSKRLSEIELNDLKKKPGPVVTISRLAGCSSQKLAHQLASRLNEVNKNSTWSVISKEVLHETANQLKLNPKKIKSIFKIKDRTVFDDIMQGFLSKDYHLERKMKNTVMKVIHRFSVEGNKIILGRGAHIICTDIENSLHIRVVGPLEWRIKRVMKSKKYSKEEALKCILSTEKDRSNFRKSIKGKKVDCDDFDLTINQNKYSNKEMIEIILAALRIKKMI